MSSASLEPPFPANSNAGPQFAAPSAPPLVHASHHSPARRSAELEDDWDDDLADEEEDEWIPPGDVIEHRAAQGLAQFVSGLNHSITGAMELEKIEGFSPEAMFSEVFQERTDEELEAHFNVGAEATTPDWRTVPTDWPKPWAFARALVLALVVYMGFRLCLLQFNNLLLVPGMLITGAFAVPLALLIFFFEMNAPRNVSLYQLIKMVLLGGVLSLGLSLVGFHLTQLDSVLGAPAAGLIEETGKAAALILVIWNLRYVWSLNGLLFGAAVGVGFAVFETAGYGLVFGLPGLLQQKVLYDVAIPAPDFNPMLEVLTVRGVLSVLGGHVLWSAIVGAALWRVRGARDFDFEMLGDPYFLRMFGFAVVMHMIWNSEFDLPYYGKYLILGVITWIVLLAVIQDGLRQVAHAQCLAEADEAASRA